MLDLVGPFAGVVKPQSAFFELAGPDGMRGCSRPSSSCAREMGFVTILDAKRGDIASTATAYADAAFAGCSIEGDSPSRLECRCPDRQPVPRPRRGGAVPRGGEGRPSRGVFVLVRTSNPGGGAVPGLCRAAESRCTGTSRRRSRSGTRRRRGDAGLGDVGAVVGATHPRELAELRAVMPDVWLLVPGYGAQGGTAPDVRAAYLPSGLGAVVNSSRGLPSRSSPTIRSGNRRSSRRPNGPRRNCKETGRGLSPRLRSTQFFFFPFLSSLLLVLPLGGFGSLPRMIAYFTRRSSSVALASEMDRSRIRMTSTIVPGARSAGLAA